MFKKKTLFVLGAGASAEAGLPVGAALARTISEMLTIAHGSATDARGEVVLRQLNDKHPLADNGYLRAARLIHEGIRLTNSIDNFLETHIDNKLVQLVGKAAIVKAIIAAEAQSSLFSDGARLDLGKIEDTWFMKFFRMLERGVKLSNAKQIFDSVAFVVFNYDRCLEFFLLNALQLVFGIGQNEAASILDDLHILHPYGIAAPLPAGGSGVPFGGDMGFDFDYAGLAGGIKTYTEQIAAGDTLAQLHQEMILAEQIVFLGFGYLEQNMLILTPGKKMNLKPVFGTAVRISPPDVNVIRRKFADMFSGNPEGALPSMQIEDRTSAALFDHYAMTLPA